MFLGYTPAYTFRGSEWLEALLSPSDLAGGFPYH
jgi:hypothetical protein